MGPSKAPGIVAAYFTALVGLCLWTGCVSQEARTPRVGTAGVESEEASPKTTKMALSAERVPEAVKQALEMTFPNVAVAEWKMKSGNIYEAEFTFKGTEITVMFDSSGQWLETESAIDQAKVPTVVSDAAARQFKGYKVIETQSVERRGEQHLIYELHFENSTEIAKAQFSSEGAILTQSAKPRR